MNSIPEISIPKDFTRSTIPGFLDQVINNTQKQKPAINEIIFNFRTLKFIRPSGVVVLSNVMTWLNLRQKINFYFKLPRIKILQKLNPNSPIRFLDDCGFFEKCINKKIYSQSKLRPTTIPLSLVKYQDSFQWLNNTFLPWLSRNTNKDNLKGFADIQVCLMEIINNINDHSQEKIGCYFGQFFPREDKIIIAASDFGIGIPNRMKKSFPYISDPKALKMAAEEGVTTKSTKRNRGAGLDILLSNVVKNWKGEVYIYSNYAKMTCICKKTGAIDYKYSAAEHPYPGTFIEISVNAGYIYRDDEGEEFIW